MDRIESIREGLSQALKDRLVEEYKPDYFSLTHEGKLHPERIDATTPEAEYVVWVLTAPYDAIKHLTQKPPAVRETMELYELRRIMPLPIPGGQGLASYQDTVMPFPSLAMAVRYANATTADKLHWKDRSGGLGSDLAAYDNPDGQGSARWQIVRVELGDEPLEIAGTISVT
jgi:hypothetical protein